MKSPTDPNLKISIDKCFATPTTNPDDKLKYVFLRDGCPVDDTFRFHNFRNARVARFSIKSFRFQKSKSRSFFIHCDVTICDNFDESNFCRRNCFNNPAKKRVRRNPLGVKLDNPVVEYDSQLTCKSDYMQLTIAKKSLPSDLDTINLHLNDQTCIARENYTHVILTTNPNDCGTTKNDLLNRNREYVNRVQEIIPDQLVVRRRLVDIPFKCTYQIRPMKTGLSIRFNLPVVRASSRTVGYYGVRLDMFTDDTYARLKPAEMVEVDPNSPMYFQASIIGSEFDLALQLKKCFGRPMLSNDPQEHYTFIENGCARDPTVQFYSSMLASRIRFSVKPFSFSNDPLDSVVINCHVSACNPKDDKCEAGCRDHRMPPKEFTVEKK